MRPTPLLLAAALALAACTPAKPPPPQPQASLDWAYPGTPQPPGPLPATTLHTVPGSKVTLTDAQLAGDASPPDWFPADHPPAPDVVARQRPNGATPCGACHMIGGGGYLGTPDLAGLPAAYIVQQGREFREGRRASALRIHTATAEMVTVAKGFTDADFATAAAYFAALPREARYRVVETATVPATKPNAYGWLDLVPDAPAEPIAGRIIEVAEDPARMWVADPHTGIIDYVPMGAVARGAALAKAGNCAACHGAGLKGQGATPPLAGRSAAYLARMLWDIKTGARGGPAVAPMQAPAARLDQARITDLVAYVASLKP